MLFNNFELEDLYNSYEKAYTCSFSTACLNPLSLSQLLSLHGDEQDHLLQDLLNLELDYSNKYGLLDFISALKNIYTPEVKHLSCAGAAEAIVLVFSALFSTADSIIVQKPIYPSLYKVPEGLGCNVISWDFKWTDDFNFNLENLRKLIQETPSVKALVINNPNNPCGFNFDEKQLRSIIHELNGRYLISDEVFKDLCLKPTPAVADIYERGISISDISKAYGLQGLRIGWIATQEQSLIEKFLSLKSFFSLRSSILSEKIAAIALKKRDVLLKNSQKLIINGLDKIYTNPHSIKINLQDIKNVEIGIRQQSLQQPCLSMLEFSVDLPRNSFGGLSMLAKLKTPTETATKAPCDSRTFQELIQQGIFILPGSVFGEEYSEYFRLSVLKI